MLLPILYFAELLVNASLHNNEPVNLDNSPNESYLSNNSDESQEKGCLNFSKSISSNKTKSSFKTEEEEETESSRSFNTTEFNGMECLHKKNKIFDAHMKNKYSEKILKEEIDMKKHRKFGLISNANKDFALKSPYRRYFNGSIKFLSLPIYECKNTNFFMRRYPLMELKKYQSDFILNDRYFRKCLCFFFYCTIQGFDRSETSQKKRMKGLFNFICAQNFASAIEFVCFVAVTSFTTKFYLNYSESKSNGIFTNLFTPNLQEIPSFYLSDINFNVNFLQVQFFSKINYFNFSEFLDFLYDDKYFFDEENIKLIHKFIYHFRLIYLIFYHHVDINIDN
ncbi:hypothetical protein H312_01038 [Anncaliia algerae PRA339]|uniref:Uncharacterized protein n=1 Tax=Anncaliia algerae PRA339 TaxID=1288291 RepID=A0A059F2W3_9MICR|nr:hypothetical protein H312_01038 [Anncaliia algerae PRA339]